MFQLLMTVTEDLGITVTTTFKTPFLKWESKFRPPYIT